MKVRPIIYSGPMVRSIFAGNKTQTRRLVPTKLFTAPWRAPEKNPFCDHSWPAKRIDDFCPACYRELLAKLPFAKGDILWVRENWQVRGLAWGKSASDAARIASRSAFHYMATDNGEWKKCWGGWRPSIHMPRRLSRLTLVVTDVRVQRLQAISREDAIAEGATSRPDCYRFGERTEGWSMDWSLVGTKSKRTGEILTEESVCLTTPQTAFGNFINQLHGGKNWNLKPSDLWTENPWVCAVSFTAHQCNVDDFLKQREAA